MVMPTNTLILNNFQALSVQFHFICPNLQIQSDKSAKHCRFAAISGKLLPLSVNLSTQSGKEKLAHLLLHTLYPHQQR
jgi:hypothetical protein